jgi:hypothetical protein
MSRPTADHPDLVPFEVVLEVAELGRLPGLDL